MGRFETGSASFIKSRRLFPKTYCGLLEADDTLYDPNKFGGCKIYVQTARLRLIHAGPYPSFFNALFLFFKKPPGTFYGYMGVVIATPIW
jgi:hypothetical protein